MRHFQELYWSPRRNKNINVSPSTARTLNTRGWRLVRNNNRFAKTNNSISPSGRRKFSVYQNNTNSGGSGAVVIQNQLTHDQNATIQLLEQELRNQKAWITQINARTSSQLIALGESGDMRSQENLSQRADFQKLNERVSQQLIDLGSATDTLSKSIEIKKAQKTIDDVGKLGGITGGITSFFSTPSNYILVIIVVVMLVMLKK